jgi:DNA-binding GntR family transcriptional regulator
MTLQDYGLTTPASNRRVPKISEIVAAELRQKILRGEIPEGESLTPESELVLEYNVSRPSLREALRLLESQGLVAIRRGSHRGPIATKPDTEQVVNAFTMHLQLRKGTLADIYRFRMIFEPVAARMAAEAATAADVTRLKSILSEEQGAVSSGTDFGAIAWRFHSEIVPARGHAGEDLGPACLEDADGVGRSGGTTWPRLPSAPTSRGFHRAARRRAGRAVLDQAHGRGRQTASRQ